MKLLERHFDTAFDALDGIKKLRELILTLAVQGKLVSQDPIDQPASELLKEIEAEKKRLVKQGKIKEPKPHPPVSAEEIPYGLPKGWEWVRLRQISHDWGQQTPNSRFTYIDVGAIDNMRGTVSSNVQTLESAEAPSRARKIVRNGTVIYSTVRPYLLNVAVIDRDFTPNAIVSTAFAILHPYSGVESRYIYFFLRSPFFVSYVEANQKGVAYPAINDGELFAGEFPLPPAAEQLRIVAKIDELMARCDALEKLRVERDARRLAVHTAAVRQLLNVADTDGHIQTREFLGQHFGELYTVKENVTELRKAILQLAVMGKLVPQDPKDLPASELLKQIEADKKRLIKTGKIRPTKALPVIRPDEAPFSLPKGWEWIRIADVAQLITSGSRDWAKYYSTSGAIFVTMGNLSRDSYQLRMDTIRYVSPPNDSEGARTKLEEGDLLISITADVGNLGLIPAGFGDAYINQHTCLLRLMPICRNRYFAELLRSPLAKEQFGAPQRGIKNSFRLGDVEEMIVPLPPIGMQHRIVAKIDQLMTLCDTVEQLIDAARETQLAMLNAVMAQYGGQRCA
jgi:type I restriction enzyme S subunit